MESTTESTSDWPWSETLALAAHGDLIQVAEILFGTIRDHLWEMGIEKGSVVECLDNRPQWVLVQLADGGRRKITRDYAWFICVEPARRSSDPS